MAPFQKCRSSRPEVFREKGVLSNFTKFIGKHLCQSLFFNKVAGLSKQVFVSSFLNFVQLGILHFLRRSVYRALNKRLEGKSEKQYKHQLSVSQCLNIAQKAVSYILLIMLDYIKSALRKKQLITSNAEHLKENCGNTRNISFQLLVLQVCNQREKGGDLPSPFPKTKIKFPDLGGNCLDCGHLLVKFLI